MKMEVIIRKMEKKAVKEKVVKNQGKAKKAKKEKPEIINPSRKRRIAAGCGQKVEDVNRLLSQYRQMRKMFKQMNSKKARKQMRKYAENPEALNNLDFSNIN